MFEYNGTDAAVKSLKSAEVNGEIVLNVNLTLNGLSSAITTIDKATLTLPGYPADFTGYMVMAMASYMVKRLQDYRGECFYKPQSPTHHQG